MVSDCKLYQQEPPAKILLSIQQILENNAFELEDSFTITDTLKKLCSQSKKIFRTIKNPFQKSHAEEIFEKSLSAISSLEILEKTRIEEDLHFVEEIQNLSKELDKLELEFVILEPEEIQEKISLLAKKLVQATQKKSYNKTFLDRAIYQCFEKLDSIKFRLDYPIMEELSEYSYQQTFARTLKALANEFLHLTSMHPTHPMASAPPTTSTPPNINFLSKQQKWQIFQELFQIKMRANPSYKAFNSSASFDSFSFLESLWKKSTNEEKAKAIFLFLKKIQQLADLAKTLSYGTIELFFASLDCLDQKVLVDLQKMLFQRQTPLTDWQKSLKENDQTVKTYIIEALMQLVETSILS